MKSKRRILRHLAETPYTKKSALKILGFLSANGIIELDEEVQFKKTALNGEVPDKTFKDFVAWYEDESEDNEILATLLEDLSEAQKEAYDEKDNEAFDRVTKQIEFLIDALELEIPDESYNEKHE